MENTTIKPFPTNAQPLTAEQEFYLPARIVDTSTLLSADNATVMKYNDKAVIVDLPTGPKIVNFCSKIYGLVKNEEIFPQIEKLLDEKFVYERKYRHSDNCVFWADYLLQGKDMLIGKASFDDKVQPCIRIMHSYNGTVRFKAVMGFRRQICSNGLWGYVFDTAFELRHSSGNLLKIFEKTIAGVESFLEQAESFKLKYDDMADRMVVNLKERVELITAATNFPKRQMEAVIQRAQIEHSTNNLPMSDWLVYNAFNYQLNHNTEFSGDEAYRMKMDSTILKMITEGVQQGDKLVLA